MELEFIGVGEAFDPTLGNTSILVKSKINLLIDCGYAVPRNFFDRYEDQTDFIDAIYLTHFHADHFFGIPALLFRWTAEKRKKKLIFIGQIGTQEQIERLLNFAYPGMRSRITFEIHFIEVEELLHWEGLVFHFAPTLHSTKNLAIRIDEGPFSVGISGDGSLTEASQELFKPCHTLVHEAFCLEQEIYGHTSALKVIEFVQTLPQFKHLALVHLKREERKQKLDAFKNLQCQLDFKLSIPEPYENLLIF